MAIATRNPPQSQRTYLSIAAQRVDNVQPFPRHGGIQPPLEVAKVLVRGGDIAPDQCLLDSIGQRLVGRLSTPELCKVIRLLLLLMLLVDLRLRDGHRMVRAAG
jgi:hypothetical protein